MEKRKHSPSASAFSISTVPMANFAKEGNIARYVFRANLNLPIGKMQAKWLADYAKENGGYFSKILDIKIVTKTVSVSGYPSVIQLAGDYIDGFEFSHWISVSADGRTSNPVYIKDSTAQTTYICSYNGTTLNPIPYKCFAMYIKRPNNS